MRTARVAIASVTVLVVAACALPAGAAAAPPPTRACRAYDAIVQRRLRAGKRGLVNLSRTELGDYFDGQARSLAAAAAASSGPLRASLNREVELTRAAALVVAPYWGAANGHAAVAESEDAGYYNVLDYLLRDGMTTLDGQYTPRRRWALLVEDNREALTLECRELLPNERTQSSVTTGTPVGIPAGTILFSTGPAVMTEAAAGRPARELFRIDDTMVIGELVAAPVTGTLAFTAVTKSSGELRAWLAGPDGAGAHAVAADPGGGYCPGWSPDGRTIALSYDGDPRDGIFAFFTGDAFTSRVRFDDAVGCAAYLTPDQLVINAGTGNTIDPSLFTTPVTHDDRRPFARVPGCSLGGPVPSPDRTVVAVTASCVDPSRDGIYVVPVTTRAPRQILGGRVGDVAWSPDGTWLVYTHVPIGPASANSERALFVAKADGSEFLQINPGPVTSAAWSAS